VNTDEVVEHEVERQRMAVVLDLLAKGVRLQLPDKPGVHLW
jgi:hypothetical protein